MKPKKIQKLTPVLRALIEVGFIVFLFYANLLMGQFTQTGSGYTTGLFVALENIFTKINFAIAIVSALIGYFVFEFLRSRL